MGFSARKSFKFGPFRVTASRSGVSYSAGAGPARVTRRADGRTTANVNLPGPVNYSSSLGGQRSPQRSAPPTGVTAGVGLRAHRVRDR
ncbi:DUF4236 domain-containing protein [Streptomyces sp. NPDC005336]|uniref:DUF4236 domain-containing protein n=1 Tax=unclassified Streptomyces TaxID=2593676 RepID=UPI0033BAD640